MFVTIAAVSNRLPTRATGCCVLPGHCHPPSAGRRVIFSSLFCKPGPTLIPVSFSVSSFGVSTVGLRAWPYRGSGSSSFAVLFVAPLTVFSHKVFVSCSLQGGESWGVFWCSSRLGRLGASTHRWLMCEPAACLPPFGTGLDPQTQRVSRTRLSTSSRSHHHQHSCPSSGFAILPLCFPLSGSTIESESLL